MTRIRMIIFLLALGIATNAMAVDKKDEYRKVTKYATILAHAQACGQDASEESQRVEKWMDKTFSAEERSAQATIYTDTMQYIGAREKARASLVTCEKALREFKKTKWP